MILLEHEVKELFRERGIRTPTGILVRDEAGVTEAVRVIGPPLMLKAQVLHGGRGKQGLVVAAETKDQAVAEAKRLLGIGPRVHGILLEERLAITREWFVSFTIDETGGQASLLTSSAGGIDVEASARSADLPLRWILIDPLQGLGQHAVGSLLESITWPRHLRDDAARLLTTMYELFRDMDANLLEVNPLVVTASDDVIAADAKMVIDDSALFRHQEWGEKADREQLDPTQRGARDAGVIFHDLDGDVAIVSMGAGITMALMDLIQHHGGRAANFMDTTGGVGPDVARRMMEIVVDKAHRSPSVRSIVVCAVLSATSLRDIVRGMASALESRPSQVPMFACIHASAASLRHMGLTQALGELASRGVAICDSMDEASRHAVAVGGAA